MSLEGRFNKTEEKDYSHEALEIANEIKNSQNNFIQMLNELCEKSQSIKSAMYDYVGNKLIEMSYFRYKPWGGDRNSEELDFKSLTGTIEANKDKISLENLKSVKEILDEKIRSVLELLDKDFSDKKEAFSAIENAHSNIILQPIETDRIFG